MFNNTYVVPPLQTQSDMMVLHYVAQTLKLVLPLMEHPSETFLAGLEEDLIKLIMKHGQMVSWEDGEMQPEDLGMYVSNWCLLHW